MDAATVLAFAKTAKLALYISRHAAADSEDERATAELKEAAKAEGERWTRVRVDCLARIETLLQKADPTPPENG